MKRLLLGLSFILTMAFQLQAEDILTVFRASGEVAHSPIRSGQWKLLARHDTVKLSDRIRIPEGGSLRIHSSESGIIHTCQNSGTFTVKQIIKYSEAQNRSLIGAVTGELVREMSRKMSSGTGKINRVHGATSRGNNDYDNSLEKAMVRSVLKKKALLKVTLQPNGESYCLQINNKGRARRISIVYLFGGSVAFCLPPEGITVARGTTTLASPEVLPSPEGSYIAFEVKKDYDCAEFLRLLKENSR